MVYGPWGVNTPEGQIFQQLIKPFEQQYHVKIEYVGTTDYGTEAQQITSGSPPFDVVIFAPVSLARQLAEGGYLTDLTPYLQQSGILGQLIPYYVAPVNISGHIYGVPVDAWSKPGIYVYVPTMQKYGIPMPTEISQRWDWGQFLGYLQKLKANGVIPLGSGAADQWPLVIVFEPIVYSLGGKDLYYAIMCHKISYTSPIVEQAFEFYLSLIASGAFGPSAFAASQHFVDVYALMKNGTVAMYFMGDWTPFFNHNYTAFIPVMAPSINPQLADQYFVVTGGDWALVPKNVPDNKTLAIQFAIWLASQDFQQAVLKSGWRAVSPNKAAMQAALSGQISVPYSSKIVDSWLVQFSNNLVPDIADNMPPQFEQQVFWPTLAKMISDPAHWLDYLSQMEQLANRIYNQTNWDNTYPLCQGVTYTGPTVYTGPMYNVTAILTSAGIPLPSWQK
ncbi:hypothetical protein TUZN_0982 [Thermoproteus uzoniensis 768-20]|uniref:Extracellular solute-binding protein, family 1 n=1 Tax=Thermoproteus uzoniensis (strain 768-20) TaxID=999630 RepID=F2L619_THEU7|nr:hypothetical protein TUZN_0982 [Thermoproteus uzoniensis 768-20]